MTHLMTAAQPPAAQAAGRRLLIATLLFAGRALEQLAARLASAAKTEAHAGQREFHLVEQEGRMVGMLYEDGRLVALMPEVGRL